MVLRVAMFRSWRVDVSEATAATTMNALTFFIVRFSTPLVGFALLPLLDVPPGLRWLDVASLLVAVVLVSLVLLVTRGEEWATRIGRRLGLLVRSVRRCTDPEAWARSTPPEPRGRSREFHLLSVAKYRYLALLCTSAQCY